MQRMILEALEQLFNSNHRHNQFQFIQTYDNGYFKLSDILTISSLKPYNIDIENILKIQSFALNWELGANN